MPKKTTQSTGKQNGGNNGANFSSTFVRCELSDADRVICQDATLSETAAIEFIEAFIIAGIKLSFGYERQNDCMAVYASGTPNSNPTFQNKTLSARGPDVLAALTVLHHKHFVLLAEDWEQNGLASNNSKYS